MPLIGITHSLTGQPLVRLAKTLKVGIGYPKGRAIHVYLDRSGQWTIELGTGKECVRKKFGTRRDAQMAYADLYKTAPERKYPGKFGYFTFQRVSIDGTFTPDWDAIELHGPLPTEAGIVFLDNQPLRQQMEWWTAAELKCSGDGRNAMRRLSEAKTKEEQRLAADASGRGEQFFPITNGCFAYGCPYSRGEKPICKPHSRLQFQLVNAPALGSTCTFDSTGFRSATQLFSSLQQIQTITGRGNPDEGVVAGIPLTLKLLPYKTSHNGQPSTQFGVTLHLKAGDAMELVRKAITAGDEFRQVAASARLQLEAGDIEQAAAEQMLSEAAEAVAMESEFYPSEPEPGEEPSEEGFEFEEEPARQAAAEQPSPLKSVRRKSENAAPAPAPAPMNTANDGPTLSEDWLDERAAPVAAPNPDWPIEEELANKKGGKR